MTVAEAARRLEVTESRMRGLLKDVAPVEDRGKWNAELYEEREVVTIGRRLRLGHYGLESRRVIVVGPLELQATALDAAGLAVERVDTVLEGLAAHSELGMPILVVATTIGEQEFNVLAAIAERMYCILVGREDSVPDGPVRRRAVLMDRDELRKIVSHAWALVEARIEQVNLRL